MGELSAQSHYIWKEYKQALPEKTINNPRTTAGIEVYTSNGSLIIRTNEKTQVKVLSILGQTISQATIEAGVYELKINSHGIFIVKIGDFTLRVAL